MKNRIIAAALAIVTAGILITASRWSEQSATAQADPANISNQASGAISIITDTNNVQWEYLPNGRYKLLGAYGSGMYFTPSNRYIFATVSIGSATASALEFVNAAGVYANSPATTNTLFVFGSGGTAIGIGLNTNTYLQWVNSNRFWLITGTTTAAQYTVSSAGTI